MKGTDTTTEEYPVVIQDLLKFLGPWTSLDDKSAVALPVAAIKALLQVVQRSKANTMMGLQNELKEASQSMLDYSLEGTLFGRSHIALSSGCELFLKYITRTFLETPDFDACKGQVLERGEHFAGISLAARDRIANVGHGFIRDGQTVLTHGWSRVVAALLLKAAETTHFDIVILEGRPDAAGARAAALYAQEGIPTKVVLDSAMGYEMESVDLVLVGAEGVVENGGIVNKMGTFALAVIAQESNVPFYVAAESYKFARLYPLHQKDLPKMGGLNQQHLDFVDTACWYRTGRERPSSKKGNENETENAEKPKVSGIVTIPKNVKVDNPPCDYTPAKYITLLFTDLGVLTPSAVSDELIRLYQ
mmetsp:Transcript_16594/g.23391  ORF Transcript_16594/g.23391 Transcript_16594/m.23391 type:complete len:362 (+) Transcript_16594:109-1194(+)